MVSGGLGARCGTPLHGGAIGTAPGILVDYLEDTPCANLSSRKNWHRFDWDREIAFQPRVVPDANNVAVLDKGGTDYRYNSLVLRCGNPAVEGTARCVLKLPLYGPGFVLNDPVNCYTSFYAYRQVLKI